MNAHAMRLTILGSGTSTGVPMIGCGCAVCRSSDPRNKRTRSSLWVQCQSRNILIDTSIDLRQQALACGLERLDAVLFTHSHADHIHGLDELRSFNYHQKSPIPCYASRETLDRIKESYGYVFSEAPSESYRPQVVANEISAGRDLDLFGIRFEPVEVLHGGMTVFGYRFNDVAYVTDCNRIALSSMRRLSGLRLLIISTVGYKPHATHFHLDGALEIIRSLSPKEAVLTHLSHAFDHGKVSRELPSGVRLAHDGMVIEVSDS
jgi:phosphoribosyl 1,2-cyclic phosphate phosphodiesterase